MIFHDFEPYTASLTSDRTAAVVEDCLSSLLKSASCEIAFTVLTSKISSLSAAALIKQAWLGLSNLINSADMAPRPGKDSLSASQRNLPRSMV